MIHRFAIRLAATLCAAAILSPPLVAQSLTRGEPVEGNLPLGSKAGSPYDHLPAGTRLVSSFGERPVFSPDGKKIAFIGASYGDAFEMDIATRKIRNLTAHAAHNGFLRIHYLNDGSFILMGPHVPAATREATRFGAIELWWLDAAATLPPQRLGVTAFEGIAVSPWSNRIAWAEGMPKGVKTITAMTGTTLKWADVVVGKDGARLENVRDIITKPATECVMEPQDFLPGDRALTLPCYRFGGGPGRGPITDVASVDLKTGGFTVYPTPTNLYGEVEGLFPDGKRTLVECSGDRAVGMDLCVLDLDVSRPRYTRLTHIMDYGRYKYGNPVVSRDGRRIAAQVGSADVVDAGVGQGIVLIDLPAQF